MSRPSFWPPSVTWPRNSESAGRRCGELAHLVSLVVEMTSEKATKEQSEALSVARHQRATGQTARELVN